VSQPEETGRETPRPGKAPRGWDSLGWAGLGAAVVALLASLVVSVIAGVAVGLRLGLESLNDGGPAIVAGQVAMWFAWGLLSLVGLALITQTSIRDTVRRAIRLERQDWLPILGVLVAIQLVSWPLDALITRQFGPIFDPQTMRLLVQPVILVGTFTLVPLVEELWMRGLVYGALRSLGPWVAIVGATLVSSAAHLNLLQALCVLPAMFGLSWLRRHTGRLAPSILVHAGGNLISVIFLLATGWV